MLLDGGRAAKCLPAATAQEFQYVSTTSMSDNKNEAFLVVHSPAAIHSWPRNSLSDNTRHLVQQTALHANAELILLLSTASDFAC